tara:strand:- start:1907 stop:3763 length:1857 start_codon:yes stop_codon:yes gene_type:complete
MLGLRNNNGGLTLGIPLVYDGLLADHVLHTSDGSSHPSQLVVSDFRTKTSSLITGENAPFLSETPNVMVKTGQRQSKAGLLTKLNQEKVKILKSKYPTITNSSRLNKFFIQSFSKSGNAPTVAQYSKIMKDIQSKKNIKNLQGSPLEYKRILDYFQFTLVKTLNDNDKLFLYRPSVHKIHDNLSRFTNYKEAIASSYNSQNEDDFHLYNQAYFATKDRPAALAAVIRGIKTLFKRSSTVEGTWRAYAFKGNTRDNITKIRTYIKQDLDNLKIKISDYISYNYTTSKGDIKYFLNYRNFLQAKNDTIRAKILFYWIFNYPSDADGKLLQKFIAILDTFHDFTGSRATGKKPTEGGFNNIWPSGSKTFSNTKKMNFDKFSFNNVLKNDSSFIVKILGRNIYRMAKDNGVSKIVANQNTRNLGVSNQRKLSHLLYFFTNILGGSKSLTHMCEEYISQILINVGEKIEKDKFCDVLNKNGKHGLVIDIFSQGGLDCIKKQSSIHAVGIMDPAGRSAETWKEIISVDGHTCIGRGSKIPVKIDLDLDDEKQLVRINNEYKRQLEEIRIMNGNHRTTGASNVPGNKRSRTNNKPNNMNPQSQQRKIRKAVRPVTRSQTSARTPK